MSNGMSDLVRKSNECIAKAGPALERAAKIASALKLEPEAQVFRNKLTDLKDDRFKVLIFGRFRCGKSTFLNALLGKPVRPIEDLPSGFGPLPTDINPCTAKVTRIYYADEPKVTMHRPSGKQEHWTFRQYFTESRQRRRKAENDAFFKEIFCFDLGFPTPFCKNGVEIFDAPGTDDNPDLDLETLSLAQKADAVVLVLSHPATFSMSEQEYLQNLQTGGLTSYLTVINARDPEPPEKLAMPPSEDTKTVIWDRIVTNAKGGKVYSGQPLDNENIYFMNALRAFQGRMAGDEAAVRNSGILEFEDRLAKYLSAEPRFIHLKRHLGAAQVKLVDIKNEIGKQRSVLQTDRQTFESRLEKLKNDLDDIPKKIKYIPKIIEQHRTLTEVAIQQSLEELYAKIEIDLPGYMKNQPLPSLHKENFWERLKETGKAAVGLRKTLCKEAMGLAVDYVRLRVSQWREAPENESGATSILASNVHNMLQDLEAEAKIIERRYSELQIALTGWTPPEAQADMKGAGLANRITAATFGALTGNIDYVFSGGAQGWGGVFNGMIVRIATAAPLVFFFGVSLPVALPIAMAAGLAWNFVRGTDAIEGEVKDQAVKTLLRGCEANPKESIPAFGGIASEPKLMRKVIAAAVGEKFAAVEKGVMREVNDRIQLEENSIRNQQAEVIKNSVDRAEKLKVLNGYEEDIKRCGAEFDQALAGAAQGATQSA